MFDLMPHRRRGGSELVRLRDEMDTLFNRFFDMDVPWSRRLFGEGEWMPRLDLSESKETITVKAEVPGCEIDDIDVNLERRRVTIRGEKKQETASGDEQTHRVERHYGAFVRTLDLPVDVDPDNIDATYKKGVLTLVFRKTQASEARRIAIKSG